MLIFDIGSSRPARPVHHCVFEDVRQGMLHDILMCDPTGEAASGGWALVGGGRDGDLRAWDLRCTAPVVRPWSGATSGFTLGKRAKDFRTGSISCLAEVGGSTLCAGTSDGSVVVWDMRCLRSILSLTRLDRLQRAGVDSLLPHPRVRRLVVVQLSDGTLATVDVAASAPLCPAATQHTAAAHVHARAPVKRLRWHGRAPLAASGVDTHPPAFAGPSPAGKVLASVNMSSDAFAVPPDSSTWHGAEGAAPIHPLAALAGSQLCRTRGTRRVPRLSDLLGDGLSASQETVGTSLTEPAMERPGFRYRGGRLAWVYGDEWLCCAMPREAAVAMVHVGAGCDRLEPLVRAPSSVPFDQTARLGVPR